MPAPSEQTIIVTGANGFLALHVVQIALDRGYQVRGTVRTQASAAKVQKIFEKYGSQLSVAVIPDITKAELYEPAFVGAAKPITGVINVAAPFSLTVEDNARDLLEPAIASAVAILEAAKRFGPDVRRVINTSSFASMLDPFQGYRPDYTYHETDWNPITYDQAVKADNTTAYVASKVLSEKAQWDWVEREKPSFDLSEICPPWVFGPHIQGVSDLKHLNESSEKLFALLGAEKVPPIDFGGFTDSRVVSEAHILAFEKPEAGGQRFLVGSHFDYQTAVDILRVELPELDSRLPVGTPGVSEPVYVMDGSKAEKVLGIKYIPLNVTLRDSFAEFLVAEQKAN